MIDERKIDAIRNGRPFNLVDVVVFAVAAAIIVLLLIAVYGGRGGSVMIVTPTRQYSYPLNEDREINVDGHLTVVIEDGRVYVKDADCADKVCERTGQISRLNQIIACMPNGIIIKLTGADDVVEVG